MSGTTKVGRQIAGEMSQDDVAGLLGIARQNVSLTELRAMAKLRQAFEGDDIDDYLPSSSTPSGRWNGRRLWRVVR